MDVKRVGKANDKCGKPLIIDVDSVWHKRMILLSLVKMKSYPQSLFISRKPEALQRETENESLRKHRELLPNNYPRKDLLMRIFRLYQKKDGQWIEAPLLFPRIMFTNACSLKKTGAVVELHADLIACEIDVCLVLKHGSMCKPDQKALKSQIIPFSVRTAILPIP